MLDDQCRKLAAGRAYVIVEASSEIWRAETHLRVTRDGVTIARARVRPTKDAVELIAHELEHVLESLDGVKFLMEAGQGRSRVSLSAGSYETPRAIEAGRRVAQEVRESMSARPRFSPLPESR
jgi:sulfur relay (sulfurtransferase) complex TusBCD TusD component (DsrE family)